MVEGVDTAPPSAFVHFRTPTETKNHHRRIDFAPPPDYALA